MWHLGHTRQCVFFHSDVLACSLVSRSCVVKDADTEWVRVKGPLQSGQATVATADDGVAIVVDDSEAADIVCM